MRGEADKPLAVLRQDDRLIHVEPGQPVNLRFDHTGLQDRGHEALRHDFVAEEIGEICAVEHEAAITRRHLGFAARFAHREHFLVVEVAGGDRIGECGIAVIGLGDLGEDVLQHVLRELLHGAGDERIEEIERRLGRFAGGDVNGLELVLVELHRHDRHDRIRVLRIVAGEVAGLRGRADAPHGERRGAVQRTA